MSRTQTSVWPNTWALPKLFSAKQKWSTGLFLFAAAMSLYMLSNHFPLYPPQLLSMTWLDRIAPFSPLSVWIYMTDYVFAVLAFAICRKPANLNRFCYSFFALQVVSIFVFLFWPTTYPRNLFPLPTDIDPLTRGVFVFLRALDAPSNCCPSLHVSSAFLACFLFLDEQKEKFPWFLGWATAIAISTMTTKQHYLADVLAGIALAIILYLVFHRWAPYGRQAKR